MAIFNRRELLSATAAASMVRSAPISARAKAVPVISGPRNWDFSSATPLGGPRFLEVYAASQRVSQFKGSIEVSPLTTRHPIPTLIVDSLPGSPLMGRRLRVSTNVVRKLGEGEVRLWIKTLLQDGFSTVEDKLSADNSVGRLSVAMLIPDGCTSVDFGLLIDGGVTARTFGMMIDVDGSSPTIGVKTSPDAEKIAQVLQASAEPLEDWRLFDEAVTGRSLIGLGEATHGSREIFQTKAAMVKRLVLRHGTTLIAYEANLPEADTINRYVHGDDGDVRSMLKGLGTWPVACEEVATLLEWLRTHNASTDRKVNFVGIDAQSASVAVNRIRALMERRPHLASETIPERYDAVASVFASAQIDFIKRPEPHAKFVAAQTEAVLLEKQVGALGGLAAGQASELRRMARVVQQTADGLADGEFRRDQAMSANMLAAIDEYESVGPAVLWAHNAHVSPGEVGSAGAILANKLGNRYCAIGTTIGAGTYTAVGAKGLAAYPLAPGLAGSDIATFAASFDRPTLLSVASLRRSATGREWLETRREHRSTGAIADEWGFRMRELGSLYDMLCYLPTSSPTSRL